MIRITLAAFIASAVMAALSSGAYASPTGKQTPRVSTGHQVCLQAQCPGRSRIVCGCIKPVR
jgi:uncharacterized membrane protein